MHIESKMSLAEVLAITPKQAFEWIKTGHWTFREFELWYGAQTFDAEMNGMSQGISCASAEPTV